MKKYRIPKPFYSLLIALIFFTSCNGQIQNYNVSELKATLSGQPKLIKTQSSNEYEDIECGLQDARGNIWFGTTSEGVYKFDGKYFTQFTMNDGLNSNCVWSILEDKSGYIWFGTTDGICRFDGKNIVPISIPHSIRPIVNNNYYSTQSTKNTVWSMMQDRNGTIWFGTGDGVYCYNRDTFTLFLNNDRVINKDSLHLKMVKFILEDKKGNIWFASGMPPGYEGFCRYDGNMIVSFKPKNESWIRKVVKSKNENLLLATRHYGVWSYDGNSFNDYMQPKDLINHSLNDILEDNTGNLWVASDYGKFRRDTLGGLWHSNISSNKPFEKTFTKIFNQEVYFIFEDKDKYIWFSTRNMGLYRYDRKTLTKFSE